MSATGKYSDYTTTVYLQITGGGVDYDSGPYTVTFPAGEESVSLRISINHDNIFNLNMTRTLYSLSMHLHYLLVSILKILMKPYVDDDGKQNG